MRLREGFIYNDRARGGPAQGGECEKRVEPVPGLPVGGVSELPVRVCGQEQNARVEDRQAAVSVESDGVGGVGIINYRRVVMTDEATGNAKKVGKRYLAVGGYSVFLIDVFSRRPYDRTEKVLVVFSGHKNNIDTERMARILEDIGSDYEIEAITRLYRKRMDVEKFTHTFVHPFM